MDWKVIKDVIEGKEWSHYRLHRKVPIYSFTHGNGRSLSIKQWSTWYLKKNPKSMYNLVVVGTFMRNNSYELDLLWRELEQEFIYFHKIDIDNLDSQEDLNFLKKMKKYGNEDHEEEESKCEYAVYLFGLKLDYCTVLALIKNCNLMQSIISMHRWMFCFKQSSKKKDVSKLKNAKDSLVKAKDERPVWK